MWLIGLYVVVGVLTTLMIAAWDGLDYEDWPDVLVGFAIFFLWPIVWVFLIVIGFTQVVIFIGNKIGGHV